MPDKYKSNTQAQEQKILSTRSHFILIGLITFMLAPFISAYSQPVAAFSYTPTGGCSPLTVQFSNESSGSSPTYFWDFGTGYGDTTNAVHPQVTFSYRGTYNVMLIATDASGSDTVYHEIEVDESPGLDFETDGTPFCRNVPVEFRHLTPPGDADSVIWDFGDGSALVRDKSDPVYHDYASNGVILAQENSITKN